MKKQMYESQNKETIIKLLQLNLKQNMCIYITTWIN